MTLDVEMPANHDDVGSARESDVADHRANRMGVWALITAATLVVVLSAVNVWVKRQVLDTDNWVDASVALIENDEETEPEQAEGAGPDETARKASEATPPS
jgi:hypothetical protein